MVLLPWQSSHNFVSNGHLSSVTHWVKAATVLKLSLQRDGHACSSYISQSHDTSNDPPLLGAKSFWVTQHVILWKEELSCAMKSEVKWCGVGLFTEQLSVTRISQGFVPDGFHARQSSWFSTCFTGYSAAPAGVLPICQGIKQLWGCYNLMNLRSWSLSSFSQTVQKAAYLRAVVFS